MSWLNFEMWTDIWYQFKKKTLETVPPNQTSHVCLNMKFLFLHGSIAKLLVRRSYGEV